MMRKLRERNGFTLAELLIVVAIIAVLVAVAIPVFTSQLDKARVATEQANARSTYAEAAAGYISDPASWNAGSYTKTYDGVTYTPSQSNSGASWAVSLTNKKSSGGAATYTYP